MTTPFDALASSYNALWSNTQREEVWREIDGLFQGGDRVLDLGCGPGDDALHLARLGVEVIGIDAAPKMVEVARSRGVNASLLAIEDLDNLASVVGRTSRSAAGLPASFGAGPLFDPRGGPAQTGRSAPLPTSPFSGALSNFGALNCVADLRPVAEQLARRIQPHGPLAICVMGRFCLADWRHATKRWFGHTQWRGMDVYYPTSHQVRTAFAPSFTFEKRVAIGRGDHQLYIFRRRTEC
jgi:SAM-dependent methyltransferase